MTEPQDTTTFSVYAPHADALWFCLFDGDEEQRLPMVRAGDHFSLTLLNLPIGQAYGYRAAGIWQPERGYFYDPSKLLVDPRATRIDRPFRYDPRLSLYGEDTAALVPKSLVEPALPPLAINPPCFAHGGLIYEVNVRSFTMAHPDVPPAHRGTLKALTHPAIIAHLQKIGVGAVELMPVTAWIDERHLPPLGLVNAWGYNPVVPMALDPRLAPNGIADLREATAALHQAGIAVILDVVFNHNGESDIDGPVIALRGLDNRSYFAHTADATLINDTGTGNTLDFGQPAVQQLMIDSLRHFVQGAGIDGFRFDLAPIIARSPAFDPHAPIFKALADDPVLADRIMIAEPWDIGPGGYQLGHFPEHWLEWNDRYRDDVRRFWKGEASLGTVATRLAGSSDLFHGPRSRSVNFIAAHDGFTLADCVAYTNRHNHANGEDNRDGHHDNHSWNNGAEGPSDDPAIIARRRHDLRALLATLFASKGSIMLTAGDECGRSQHGNNNAYCQDTPDYWFDWQGRDTALEDFVAELSRMRAAHPALHDTTMFTDADWRRLDGGIMTAADWEDPATTGFTLHLPQSHVTITIDRVQRLCRIDEQQPPP